MYRTLIGEKVTVVVSSKGEYLLEYVGTLSSENDEIIELSNVNISYLALATNLQKGFFGQNCNIYKERLDKVIVNKVYIISCNK